jgi:hypothetical protein
MTQPKSALFSATTLYQCNVCSALGQTEPEYSAGMTDCTEEEMLAHVSEHSMEEISRAWQIMRDWEDAYQSAVNVAENMS